MIEHSVKVRVRYAEVDRMGYVYYGNYATYFEVARVETLRTLGVTYRELEDGGIILPVLDYSIKYFKPAFYDEELIIKTKVKENPRARIGFEFETYNASDILLNVATVTLVFVNRETGKPCLPPDFLKKKFDSFFI
jgi:acyl-CoA thioester hydrolase